MQSKYGTAQWYVGAHGAEYFGVRERNHLLKGAVEAKFFLPYVKPELVVLDLGCGSGSLLSCLPAHRKIGVEINPLARSHAQRFGIETLEDLSLVENDTIDVVISNHCLEHIPSPYEALVEVKRVLKNGGRLVLITPIDDWRNYKTFRRDDKDHHLFTWTPQNMGNILDHCGFATIRVKIVHFAFPTRYWPMLHQQLPQKIFYAVCYLWSFVVRRQAVVAIATKV